MIPQNYVSAGQQYGRKVVGRGEIWVIIVHLCFLTGFYFLVTGESFETWNQTSKEVRVQPSQRNWGMGTVFMIILGWPKGSFGKTLMNFWANPVFQRDGSQIIESNIPGL